MAKSIEDFLVALDTDSELKAAYEKDPIGTAKAYGLSEEDIQLFKEKNWSEIEKQYNDIKRVPRVVDY